MQVRFLPGTPSVYPRRVSQLQSHLLGDRPRWSGELVLDYTDGEEWVHDLGLARRRLGWDVLPCDDIASRAWAYVATNGGQEGRETWVTLRLLVERRGTLPRVVQVAFETGEGRHRFLQSLKALAKEPLTEAPSRWDRLGMLELELEDD